MEMKQTDLVDFFGQAFRYASMAQEERNCFVRQEGKTAAVLLAGGWGGGEGEENNIGDSRPHRGILDNRTH